MKTVVCYGDSNTYGYNPLTGTRYPANVRYPGVLAYVLGPSFHVVEEGCNGRTAGHDDPVEGWKNGKDYLKPCLNSHKPVDYVVLMLGTNDLKEIFHATTEEIASKVEILVEIIQSFTREKQGFSSQIVLIAPPEIGEDVTSSDFCRSFRESAVKRSREFPEYYKAIAEKYGCLYLAASDFIEPSKADCVHLMPEAHETLGRKIAEIILSAEE